jgi:RecB family exonuclease
MKVKFNPDVLPLSASAVRSYRSCAYRYALENVDQLPEADRVPVPALALGHAVHKALEQFTLTGGHAKRSFEDLLGLLRRYWKADAFRDAATAEAEFGRAVEMLERYYFNPYPAHIEHDVATEAFVKWRKPHRGFELRGKMDRVCMLPGRVLEVVDYKTSRTIPSPDEAAADEQTFFYRTLAADVYRDWAPSSIRITYLYLVGPTAVTVAPDRDDVQARWREVAATGAEIKGALAAHASGTPLDEAFPPNRGSACRSCQMRQHCDATFPKPAETTCPPGGGIDQPEALAG